MPGIWLEQPPPVSAAKAQQREQSANEPQVAYAPAGVISRFRDQANLPHPHAECLSRFLPEPGVIAVQHKQQIEAEPGARHYGFAVIEQQRDGSRKKQHRENQQAVINHGRELFNQTCWRSFRKNRVRHEAVFLWWASA